MTRVLDGYLSSSENADSLRRHNDLLLEVQAKYAYIRQARQVRLLEDIISRNYKGERLGYGRMLSEAVALLHDLKFDLANYFDPLVESILHHTTAILDNKYIRKTYIERDEKDLTRNGLEVRKNYRKLVSLLDEFRSIRNSKHPEPV